MDENCTVYKCGGWEDFCDKWEEACERNLFAVINVEWLVGPWKGERQRIVRLADNIKPIPGTEPHMVRVTSLYYATEQMVSRKRRKDSTRDIFE